jgi:hypothetical protein
MSGPNYVLDKGYNLLNSGAAQSIYRFMKFASTENSVLQQTASNLYSIGVCQQRVEAVDSATGNVQVEVRILGISKVEAGAAVALGAEVMSDTTGRAITAATTGNAVVGRALQAATAAGEWIDVLLTPGARLLP